MSDVQPESVNVLRVETYDGQQWLMVVHRAQQGGSFTGSIELHFCQGRVGKVQVKPKAERIVVDTKPKMALVSTR
jgi:hypothetical protein